MNPNQYNPPPAPYGDPYSPASQPPRSVPNPVSFQPPTAPYGAPQNPYAANGPTQPQYGAPQPQQQPYGPPQQNPYANPLAPPNIVQQAPLQPVQSPMMGYNPYPYPDEFTPSKRGPNKFILGVIAVIVIVGTLFGVLALNGDSNDNNNQDNPNQNNTNQNTSSDSNKDVISRTDGKLDLSSKLKVNESLKQQSLSGSMNEQINLSSGFSFMVSNLTSYTSTSNTQPATGKRFIAVTIVVGNRTESSNLSVSYLDFRLRDKNSVLIAGNSITNEILNNPLGSPTELKSGEQLTGKVVFEVADTDSTWALQHTETYQKTTDNTTFDVTGEIGLLLITRSSSTGNTTTDTSQTSTTTP